MWSRLPFSETGIQPLRCVVPHCMLARGGGRAAALRDTVATSVDAIHARKSGQAANRRAQPGAGAQGSETMGEQTGTTDLEAVRGSDDSIVLDRIVPLVYAELRAIAHRQLQREREGHTLNTTALVHEAFLRLADQPGIRWQSEAHFFAIAARVMRQVLVDYARYHRAAKRAGAHQQMELDAIAAQESGTMASDSLLADERADLLVALDEALARLAAFDERLVRVVECRFFGGLTEQETAQALAVNARTVRRDWVKAKAWLQRALDE